MFKTNKRFANTALAVLMLFGASVLGSSTAMASGEKFVLISHAPDSDSWWNTIKNAIKIAADQMDVTVDYRNPNTGDLADMARIVQQAAASNPDGIIVTIADYDVLKGPITDAIAKGIPVITINSGSREQSEMLGALAHIGQPEYAAGFGAGKRAKAAGVTEFLCVNHYMTNPASIERCQGYADALGVDLGSQMIDSGQDPTEIKNKIMAHLRSHPGTNGLLTLGPTSAHPALSALRDMGLSGGIHFGTFDLSGEIADGIKSGVISFAIDQQPYLQGYLPVIFLTNLSRYGVFPSGSINSGPGFITTSNISLVEKYAGVYR
jgi:simple sugar transport system substrate-binding protein